MLLGAAVPNKMGMRIIKDDALFFVPVRDLATDADAVKLLPSKAPTGLRRVCPTLSKSKSVSRSRHEKINISGRYPVVLVAIVEPTPPQLSSTWV